MLNDISDLYQHSSVAKLRTRAVNDVSCKPGNRRKVAGSNTNDDARDIHVLVLLLLLFFLKNTRIRVGSPRLGLEVEFIPLTDWVFDGI